MLVTADDIVVHADPVETHLDHFVAHKGFEKAVQVAVDGRLSLGQLPEDLAAHDEAPAAPMSPVKSADSDELPVCPQLDEDIPTVGIGREVPLAELIHGRDPAPFVRIVSEDQASFQK